MIFVTVGMHNKGFDRLVQMMDEIAGLIEEDMIMQIGSSSYIPKNAKFFDFTDNHTFLRLFSDARLIVSHAGAGTIIDALSAEKPLILVPRRMEYGECVDNQQLELAYQLQERGNVLCILDEETINIETLFQKLNPEKHSQKNKSLIQFLKKYFENFTTNL